MPIGIELMANCFWGRNACPDPRVDVDLAKHAERQRQDQVVGDGRCAAREVARVRAAGFAGDGRQWTTGLHAARRELGGHALRQLLVAALDVIELIGPGQR